MTILEWAAWLVVLWYVADLSAADHATLRWLAVPVAWLWALRGVLLVPRRAFQWLTGLKAQAEFARAGRGVVPPAAQKIP
jgi:hypothetical protein